MLNQRLTAAKAVADELFPAESDLENALLHTARLTIAVVEGRRHARLPITTGQEGLARVARATACLVEAREQIGAAHLAFRETQIEIGLRTVSFGHLWECPENKSELLPEAANVA